MMMRLGLLMRLGCKVAMCVHACACACMRVAVRGQMIEVISDECKRNNILMCRAYVDMSNMMTRIRILSSALNRSLLLLH